jgi:hypothetical protein
VATVVIFVSSFLDKVAGCGLKPTPTSQVNKNDIINKRILILMVTSQLLTSLYCTGFALICSEREA